MNPTRQAEVKPATEASRQAIPDYFESIVETVRQPLVVLDAGLCVVTANRAFYQIFQASPEATEGHGFFGLDAGQWNVPALRNLLENIFSQNTPFDDFEIESKFRGIGHRFMLLNARQIQHANSAMPLILLAIEDVTERRRAEEKAKIFAAKLERSNRELQDFASVASHDLQEPLRKIQTFGDRLKARGGATLDEEGRDYLERMQKAASRMQSLINDLLMFARIEINARPFAPVDLNDVAREVLSDLEIHLEQGGGRVDVGPLPIIDADPLQMRQLIQNLIGNALKYCQPGKPPVVKVHAEVVIDPRQSARDGNPPGDLCRLFVEDNGIGFDEKYLDRIFTVFQRLHGRLEYSGTGVGLAVCRKIVERHGGNITARSQPGHGATFVATLPLRQRWRKRDER